MWTDDDDDLFFHSYLNSQHIQKQKFSDADLTYGSMQMDVSEQLLEIGEPLLNLGRGGACGIRVKSGRWSTAGTVAHLLFISV